MGIDRAISDFPPHARGPSSFSFFIETCLFDYGALVFLQKLWGPLASSPAFVISFPDGLPNFFSGFSHLLPTLKKRQYTPPPLPVSQRLPHDGPPVSPDNARCGYTGNPLESRTIWPFFFSSCVRWVLERPSAHRSFWPRSTGASTLFFPLSV